MDSVMPDTENPINKNGYAYDFYGIVGDNVARNDVGRDVIVAANTHVPCATALI